MEVQGGRLASFSVTTSSGDVVLGLPADGSFDAEADQSSGDMVVGFAEGTAIHDDEALVGLPPWKRGSEDPRVDLERRLHDRAALKGAAGRLASL